MLCPDGEDVLYAAQRCLTCFGGGDVEAYPRAPIVFPGRADA